MWQELGIPPTHDVFLIRKAYAARLKIVSKAGDRAAFQRLRAAYERACAMAARAPKTVTVAPEPDIVVAEPEIVAVETKPPEIEPAETVAEIPAWIYADARKPDIPAEPETLLVEAQAPEQTQEKIPEQPPEQTTEQTPEPQQEKPPEIIPVQTRPPLVIVTREDLARESVTREPPAIKPPPRPPDPRAQLFAALRDAMAAHDIDQALTFYERGLAQGLLPLGSGASILDDIMTGPVNNKSLSGARFEALMARIGWDVPARGHPDSRIQTAAMARLDAERWLRHLEERATGKERLWPLLRATPRRRWLTTLIRRQSESANARLMLTGRRILPPLAQASVVNLRSQLASYYHFRPWVEGRIPERAVSRAEKLLAIEKRWGKTLRRLGVMAMIWAAIAAMALLGNGFSQAVGSLFVLLMAGALIGAVIGALRRLFQWCAKFFSRRAT